MGIASAVGMTAFEERKCLAMSGQSGNFSLTFFVISEENKIILNVYEIFQFDFFFYFSHIDFDVSECAHNSALSN